MVVLARLRLKPNLAPLGARFIPYKTLVYLNVWEIKVNKEIKVIKVEQGSPLRARKSSQSYKH